MADRATPPPDADDDAVRVLASRCGDPFVGKVYDADGSFIVGEGFVEYTTAQRRTINARNAAFVLSFDGFDGAAIELELFPEPENETLAATEKRLLAVRQCAMELAEKGDVDLAIELGVLPKPKVEPQPRKVTRTGKLVSEAVALEF